VPEAEVKGEIGDQQVGLQARLMSQAMRILTPVIGRTRTCMVFINQIRMKIGVMFGSPETTSGGQALKFYSSVRLDIRKITSVKDGEDTVGSRVRVKVVKNKVAPPFKQAEFDLFYDRGACREGDLIDLAVEDGLIDKSGSWLSYGEQRWQGRDKFREHLRENQSLVEEIRNKILVKRGMMTAETVNPENNGKPAESTPAKTESKKEPASRRQPAAATS
jgi:recombination protein RecA